MADPYAENEIVELPALALLGELGWRPVFAAQERLGGISALGRRATTQVVLVARLQSALESLNPGLSADSVSAVLEEVVRDRSAMDLAAANRDVYTLLKDGIPVSIPDKEHGGQKIERLRVIDWENPTANDFFAVRQMTFLGPFYPCRPDIVGFVNGLPLVVIEFKKPGVPVRQAFHDNISRYKDPQNGVPALFWYNALMIVSNGTESRIGSLTADWERFFEWKRVESETEPRRVSLETVIRGTCDKERLLDLTENFTLFSAGKTGIVKALGQNHQFIGVNNTIASVMKARSGGNGRGGVFWQTQGSGKSFSMVFFAQKILRKVPGNWTFVVVTDRVELDQQIAKTFASCGAVTDANECHAVSSDHLRRLLGENHRYVFTLIHKFQSAEVLCDRRDVIVLTDEAHRSQYDTLALNMRAALPNAIFVAFTGTPLIASEGERTREVFGDYVSIYDFQQSVEDGATVPLFYENRTPELELTNPQLNEDIYRIVDDAGLNEVQEEKLGTLLARQYHILTRDDRLETIAKDIVWHFLGRGFQGKAMVVSLDKATALKMYNKVQKHWLVERQRVQAELAELRKYKPAPDDNPSTIQELNRRLKILSRTDMALVVSEGQNEVEQMRALGLDIAPHRKRMNDSRPPLDEKFKDPQDPLSMVFVCAMWLTGFDVPSCSTIYLDKPMRNHTLMQTIARGNRVYPGKHNGLIVDYANVFESLERALAIYGIGTSGERPVQDKAKLVEDLQTAISDATLFCANHGIALVDIERVVGLEKLSRLGDAVNAFITPDPLRKDLLAHVRVVQTLFDAVKPDRAALEFGPRVLCLCTIADAIKAQIAPGKVDVSNVMSDIQLLLDSSVEGVKIQEDLLAPPIDLSKLDFVALAARFKESPRKNIELETLKSAVRTMLDRLIRLNKTRIDFQEKFEELIEAYNNGTKNIEDLFNELLALSQALTEEQARHVRENLTEEELTIFDILTRPGPSLTSTERDEVKRVAHLLLERLKTILTFNWRQTIQARAKVRNVIEEALDSGLPRAYTSEIFKRKAESVFEHVYERYSGAA